MIFRFRDLGSNCLAFALVLALGPAHALTVQEVNAVTVGEGDARVEALQALATKPSDHTFIFLQALADGTVKTFDGDMDEYRRFVLDQARAESRKNGKSGDEDEPKDTLAVQRQNNAKTRRETAPLRKKIEAVEARMAKFAGLITKVDDMLAHPDAYAKDPAKATLLAQQRAELVRALAGAEEEWLALSEELEAASA
jgi:hypothetical protein